MQPASSQTTRISCKQCELFTALNLYLFYTYRYVLHSTITTD